MCNGIHTHLTHHPLTNCMRRPWDPWKQLGAGHCGWNCMVPKQRQRRWMAREGGAGSWWGKKMQTLGLGMARAPLFLVWDISKQAIHQSISESFFWGGIRISQTFPRFYYTWDFKKQICSCFCGWFPISMNFPSYTRQGFPPHRFRWIRLPRCSWPFMSSFAGFKRRQSSCMYMAPRCQKGDEMATFEYNLGCPPSQDSSGKWRSIGIPY